MRSNGATGQQYDSLVLGRATGRVLHSRNRRPSPAARIERGVALRYEHSRKRSRGGIMSDFTVKRVEEMERGAGGAFVLARASVGVSSFGLQLLDLPPGWAGPEHSHDGMTGELATVANDGQEEVYFGLEGTAFLKLGDDEVSVEPGVMVRCGPTQMRQVFTRDESARLLAMGAVPGAGYTA